MAEQKNTLEQWLKIQGGPTRGLRQRHRNAVGHRTIALLRTHAPDVAALKPDAAWDAQIIEGLAKDIDAGEHRAEVHNAIAQVIDLGRCRGLWDHASWPRRQVVPHTRSRLRRPAIASVAAADTLLAALFAALPAMAIERDPAVLAGACLVSATLCSGLLQEDWLDQVLDPTRPVESAAGLLWFELALGRPDARWRGVRRWFLDDVTAYLRGQYLQTLATHGQARPSTDAALKALEKALAIPVPVPARLLKLGDARWAVRLPAFMHEYLRNPSLAISLSPSAWRRLLTGRSLTHREGLLVAATNPGGPARHPGNAPALPTPHIEPSRDLLVLARALKDLKRCLRRYDKKLPKVSRAKLRKRLGQWQERHAGLGGWLAWLAAWIEHRCLRTAREAPSQESDRIATTLRYLDGFADRFVAALRDLPPHEVDEAPQALADQLALLREELQTLTSAGVAAAGLRQFLAFVAHRGGPVVSLDSEWSGMAEPRQARATMLTLHEYRRLLGWLKQRFAAGSFPLRRARVMAALAFRLGLRWEEVRDLRIKDVRVYFRRQWRGEVWIRATAHSDRKSANSVRKLPLEWFLTPHERVELAALMGKSAYGSTVGRAPGDYLFADPGDPARPPAPENTHDAIQEGMRWASGDPTLVFHDLRHSAANYALVRLLLARHAGLADRVPGLGDEEAAIGLDRPLACLATGRGTRDGARLYALSELMGHLDPGVTLRHYVHLLDLAVGLAMHEHLALPPQVESRLSGVRVASIRKRRYRQRASKRR